ncbi:MAG: heme exporter protein CcmB, partial [Armatimonadota bacterium]|nr:heme exporter protein CcmB [Armatimonadota bacterium]
MKAWRRVAAVARKDLLLEWRGRDAVLPAGSFGFAVLLVLGLVSGGGGEAAPSALWVSVLLAAVLAAGRGADREGEEGTREVL